MHTATNTTILLGLLIAAAVIVAALAGLHAYRRRQSARLKGRFAEEYDRTVRELGNQSKAEAELRNREARVAKFSLRSLTPEETARFTQAWNRLQGQFVDSPKGAVVEADKLVTELMTVRGYPMSDFERRASDVSVDHPGVIEAYRAARAIAVKNEKGLANTEELRNAIVHYRSIFAELLQNSAPHIVERPQRRLAVHS
jgi:hypothetical protein